MNARSEAFAPGSIGNLGVGFDVLGLAIEGAGDTVRCELTSAAGCILSSIRGDAVAGNVSPLPTQADKNTATIAAARLWSTHGDGRGIQLELYKGTPLASGMGSSAASAVAAVMAVNVLLDQPLPRDALLPFALEGEAFASGAVHADNVAPSLFGGLVLCPPQHLPAIRQLPVPEGLSSVLVHPRLHVETAAARAILSSKVRLTDALEQAANLATLVDAAHRNDARAFASAATDCLIEPQRKSLVRGFDQVQQAAFANGAFSCSLSGSGPSIFAICGEDDAVAVSDAMIAAFEANGVSARAWRSSLMAEGASAVVLQ